MARNSERQAGMTAEEMRLWVGDPASPRVRIALRRLAGRWSAWPRPYASSNSRRFGAALRDAERRLC